MLGIEEGNELRLGFFKDTGSFWELACGKVTWPHVSILDVSAPDWA